jgi:geranylgeranyl diphosphate synthase type II
MELKTYLANKRAVIDEALRSYLPKPEKPAGELFEAMNYSLFAGGKRLRPILCVASCEAVGGKEKDALPVACALEMIHTYSLIHDDLPAMDNDDMRRGKPTNHKVYGEALAMLAGDALLTEAFNLISRLDLKGEKACEVVPKIVAIIASAAGPNGMVGGPEKMLTLPLLNLCMFTKQGPLLPPRFHQAPFLEGFRKINWNLLTVMVGK